MLVEGKTLKGKNKIREAGTNEWKIVRRENSVQSLWGRPGVLIEPLPSISSQWRPQRNLRRWVLEIDDPDFTLKF